MNRAGRLAPPRLLILLLVLPLHPEVLLADRNKEKELVLGEAGKEVRLPCRSKEKKDVAFIWKQPDGAMVIRGGGPSVKGKGPTQLQNRVIFPDQKDLGNFPLIIQNAELADSKTYFCEVEGSKKEVQLLVLRMSIAGFNPLSASGSISLLTGMRMNVTLHGQLSVAILSAVLQGPKGKKSSPQKLTSDPLVTPPLGIEDSGLWKCIVSVPARSSEPLTMAFNIQVQGFQKPSETFYGVANESVTFAFPLNFKPSELSGELDWNQKEPFDLSATLSLKNEKQRWVWRSAKLGPTEEGSGHNLSFRVNRLRTQHAGSGCLRLRIENQPSGKLEQKVELVVMEVSVNRTPERTLPKLKCEVHGPELSSSALEVCWALGNKSEECQKQRVQVEPEEAGIWKCQLRSNSQILLRKIIRLEETRVLSRHLLLGSGLGVSSGLLLAIGLVVFCSARRRHRRQRAERVSQIRRLLNDNKTCQCPHRFQKRGFPV
ncbi:T-cell surface glycoprotein CD4 [Tachyglossus aculeatus]|uniref:T-cell surface glycoprotein CD4 n=1 Tax=Tachyglossus aculeatus TaxID=9261 RepID=UPI0018F6CFFF|nr:T-cell surface glycoprotein CD4 [Tachyglossus aculeatus]